MSDSETSATTAESQPQTNGNPVPIDVVIKVDAPDQVEIGSWPYPLIVEMSWRDPDINQGSKFNCFCEGFKHDSEDVLFNVAGQDIGADTEHHGIQDRGACLFFFYPDDNFDEGGQFMIRMTMTVTKNSKDLPPKIIESKLFTVTEDILDSDIKPSKQILNLAVASCVNNRNIRPRGDTVCTG